MRELSLQDFQRNFVIRIPIRWNEHNAVRNVEICVACWQTLAFVFESPWHGQFHNSERAVLLIVQRTEALQVVPQWTKIFIKWVVLHNRDDSCRVHEPC